MDFFSIREYTLGRHGEDVKRGQLGLGGEVFPEKMGLPVLILAHKPKIKRGHVG